MAQREREIFACAKIDSARVIDEAKSVRRFVKLIQSMKVGASFFWFVDKEAILSPREFHRSLIDKNV